MQKILIPLILLFMAGCKSLPSTPPVIFLAGDSTLAEKKDNRRPETGWGEMLNGYFTAEVLVKNHAVNGRSTRSFRTEGKWQAMLGNVRPGDYVLIEFGHNDSKPDTARFSSPATYQRNLENFVKEVLAQNAQPVLLTPIVRRKFDEAGVLTPTHGEYPSAVRTVAREMKVPLIDLNVMTRELVNGYGPEKSKELFLWLNPGEHPNYPEGVMDDTHLSPQGATIIAGQVAATVKRLKLPVSKYLKVDKTPTTLYVPVVLLLSTFIGMPGGMLSASIVDCQLSSVS